MITQAERNALEVGDEIGATTEYNYEPFVVKVGRITKTQIIIYHGGREIRFAKNDGRQIGASSRWRRGYLISVEDTKKAIAFHKVQVQQRDVLHKLVYFKWSNLSAEQAQKVLDLVESFKQE